MSEIPTPGSSEAVVRGCRCAVLDNARGRGYMGQPGIFVVTGNCPLHGLGTDWGRPSQAEGDNAVEKEPHP